MISQRDSLLDNYKKQDKIKKLNDPSKGIIELVR